MNLLFTLTSYPPAIGGAQELMHQLACELTHRHGVQVVTQWDTNRTDWLLGTTLNVPAEARSYAYDGVPVQRLTLPAAVRGQLAPWVYMYYVLQGAALSRISAALASELAPLAANADLIHNCRIGREGLSYASLRVARSRSIPFVLTPVHHARWGGWLHRHYQRLYRQADALIALTESERQTLVGLGVDESRVAVTGMGPVLAETPDGARFRQQHGLGAEPIILFLGQKYAYKGLAALAAAAPLVWRRLPEVCFAFVGPRTTFSRRLFSTLRDARLLELDAVSLQEKTDALAACDVLCVPSTQESFGGVYTEAWSLSKPVVAADIPALREVISDGQDGLLVRPQAAAIAEGLSQLLEHPALATEMGRRGREKVEARFSWPRLAALTEAVYERVLGHGVR
jgi:glycosyltransferase involved in cell wall biosynthesis